MTAPDAGRSVEEVLDAIADDATVEAATRAVWDHFFDGGQVRKYGRRDWPPPEQHMDWWRGIARAALRAAADRIESAQRPEGECGDWPAPCNHDPAHERPEVTS